MSKKKEWGSWECPICGDVCQDPANKAATQCHNGHSVYLGPIGDNGQREAYLQDEGNEGDER